MIDSKYKYFLIIVIQFNQSLFLKISTIIFNNLIKVRCLELFPVLQD